MDKETKQRLEKLGRLLGVAYFFLGAALTLATLGALGECWYRGQWLVPWETVSGRLAMLACLVAGFLTVALLVIAIWLSPGGNKPDDKS